MLSICLLTRGENKYLKEWVDYHINMGVNHFYIYDNNPIDFAENEILKYFDKKYFTFIHWLKYKSHMQIEAYNHCIANFGSDNEWIAFIDTDEFINCLNLLKTLQKYKQYDFIKIPWVVYNANGEIYYRSAPVRERFTKISNTHSSVDYYKSIVQPQKIDKMFVHDAIGPGKSCLVEDIKLDHYYTRSLEEWVEKMKRGSCSSYCTKKYDEFFIHNPDLIAYKHEFENIDQKYNQYSL